MPGYDVARASTRAASPCRADTIGSLVVKLPLPPACLPTLWQQDERFRKAISREFPGYYKTADAGYIDEDGYVYVMGRTDDIINVAGHRLSTGGMEEVLAAHPDVAECAVLGIKDDAEGRGALRLHRAQGRRRPRRTARSRRRSSRWCATRSARSPRSSSRSRCARLPKTRSGKILRGTIKKIADGDAWTMPATIEDPKVLDEIGEALKGRGVG